LFCIKALAEPKTFAFQVEINLRISSIPTPLLKTCKFARELSPITSLLPNLLEDPQGSLLRFVIFDGKISEIDGVVARPSVRCPGGSTTYMKFSKLFACVAVFAAGAAVYADTYALCIGINDYPTTKDEQGQDVDNDLAGCVNDANSMRDLLTAKFNVPADHVKVLTDAQANADGFVGGVKWLLETAKPGDQIVFSYSGHGARLDDPAAEGGKQSVIVLSDLQLVPGTIFKAVSRKLSEGGVNSTFIFDSCFSGGMSRTPGGEFKVRRKSLGDLKSGTIVDAVKSKDFVSVKKRGQQDGKGQFVFLFAGKDDQPTIDITLKDQPAHGLFTMLFLDSMQDNPAVPVKDLFGTLNALLDEINKAIKEKRPDAEPFDQKPGFDSSSADRAAEPIVIG
jgi:hypothetical protein